MQPKKDDNATKTTSTKKKKEYKYNDEIISERSVFDIKVRVIKNEKGNFVDLRRFFNGLPTKKGVRLPLKDYQDISKFFEDAIQSLQNQ